MPEYRVRLRHDKGRVNIRTAAPSPEAATAIVLRAENAPAGAVLEVVEIPVVPLRWDYGLNGNDITSQPLYAEDDADEATARVGAHGDSLIVALEKTPRGRWKITGTDSALPVSWYDKRFRSPGEALAELGERWDCIYREAVCRCGTPDDCD